MTASVPLLDAIITLPEHLRNRHSDYQSALGLR
jgi:hypothetical protein